MDDSTRAIGTDDRTGVLAPENLTRFAAQWITPASDVRDVVDTYWSVHWSLAPGEVVDQRIVDFPAITLSVEEGDVPGRFMVSTIRPRAWSRAIRGTGRVFAIRLRPAGLGVLSNLEPQSLEHEQEISRDDDALLHDALSSIAAEPTEALRAHRANSVIADALRSRPLSGAQSLANAAVDSLTASPQVRAGETIARELSTSVRTLQRALRSTIGIGPLDVARRIRLQEVVRRLSTDGANMASIAAELGYVDQAHVINEFRRVSGTTPGRYVRMLHDAQRQLSGSRRA